MCRAAAFLENLELGLSAGNIFGRRTNRESAGSRSVFTLATIGYDFAEALGANEALLSSNYVYQNPRR